MKICPKCNIEHEKPGTYCSRSCANSRSWSEEDKIKKSNSAKSYYQNNVSACTGKPGWKHSDEMKEHKRKKSLEFWDKKGRRTIDDIRLQSKLGVNKYRARKYEQTPNDADFKLIREIYKMCPKGYEVDHIIPICRGGLHHENNLQYLPAKENRKKNRFDNYNMSVAIKWQDVL